MADKSLNEIRNTFLKYFEKNDHRIVESSNLVPNIYEISQKTYKKSVDFINRFVNDFLFRNFLSMFLV